MRPTLFRLTLGDQPWPVSSYTFFGVLAAIYLLVVLWWLVRKKQPALLRQHTSPQLAGLALASVVSFFIGARLLYGVLYFSRVQENPSLLWQFQLKNFSLQGGLWLVLLFWYLVARRQRLSLYTTTDLLVLHIGFAVAIMRLGCFFNGCCFGIPTDLPWGVTSRLADGGAITRLIGVNAISTGLFGVQLQPRHPTQLYEMATGIIASLAAALALWWPGKNDGRLPTAGSGFATAVFGLVFSLGRLLTFFFREFPTATSTSNFIRGPVVYGLSLVIFSFMLKRAFVHGQGADVRSAKQEG